MDLSDPDTYIHGLPHHEFRRLRAEDPVSWQSEPGGRGFWAITRHADVMTVLRDPRRYSSWRGGALLADPPAEFLEKLREGMLNRDPPDHTMLRRLVNKAFNPRRVAELEVRVARRAAELVTAVRDRGACDFAVDVAGEMPLFVICEILGVPLEDRARLFALTERMLGTNVTDRAASLRDGMAAADEMRTYGAHLGAHKRAHPADDLVSDLLAAEFDGRRLTDGEFQAFFMLLFNAGSDTTRSLLCFGLDLLIDRPDAYRRLQAEPSLIPNAVEEMLRFDPPVIQFRRTATEAAELGGRTIAEGDKVVVFFPSANRDEQVFADPDRFDIDRPPGDHLAFGYGTHYCVGAPLARMEAKYVLRELVSSVGQVERTSALVASRSNFIRGARHLQIRYRRA
ncbi:MAG: cytochrome P450 [Myxococcales bacterium]|nr:cytochrome P450 [Myxococcales bacterium]